MEQPDNGNSGEWSNKFQEGYKRYERALNVTYHAGVITANLAVGGVGAVETLPATYGTLYAEAVTANSEAAIVGTEATQSMTSTTISEVTSGGANTFNRGVYEKFVEHAFANGRHSDLGLSVEPMAEKGFSLINQNLAKLANGNNTLTAVINGVQKSFTVFVENGAVKSLNMYPGISTRVTTGTLIDLGKVVW